jgi:hypothetical protein
MRLSIVAATATLLAAAEARLIGIAVPDVIKPGEGFNAIIMTENYIQSVYDVAIAFGYKPAGAFPDSLGTVLDSFYLGPCTYFLKNHSSHRIKANIMIDQSNQLQNVTKWVQVRADAPRGRQTVVASLMSLYGAGSLPVLSNWNVTVTFGDFTSNHYISSLNS